jgi:hypothetical protein
MPERCQLAQFSSVESARGHARGPDASSNARAKSRRPRQRSAFGIASTSCGAPARDDTRRCRHEPWGRARAEPAHALQFEVRADCTQRIAIALDSAPGTRVGAELPLRATRGCEHAWRYEICQARRLRKYSARQRFGADSGAEFRPARWRTGRQHACSSRIWWPKASAELPSYITERHYPAWSTRKTRSMPR